MEEKEILQEEIEQTEKVEAAESTEKVEKPKRKSKTQVEMQKLIEENDRLQNYALRMKADMENIKKRNENIARDMYNDGKNDAVLSFLPVVDNLERAMELEMPEGIKEGLSKVKKQIDTIFERLNIKEIECIGVEFDPNIHNALMQIDDDANSGKCVQVYEKGYKINDKILRHASVVVAK
ncbi:MAG: nucleotide exchange factor GrpE [Clostridia bacterium]|nr:nucleotide exchange factor GrpE [Clostridia bacterium]